MARPVSKYPTEGEIKILRVFWESTKPGLTVRDVHDHMKDLSFTTIATMVRIMVGKGWLKLTDERRPQVFAAVLDPKKTFERMTKHLKTLVLG